MSRQARRARGREQERRRRQVARLIALATIPDVESLHCSNCAGTGEIDDDEPETCGWCGGSGRGLDVAALDILSREVLVFDVALARAYGERLVREGEDALATWAVYLDWLRATGWFEVYPDQWTTADGPRLGMVGGFPAGVAFLRDGWASTYGRGKRPRMDGAAMVRMGRRLLAALDGQPSECQQCKPEPPPGHLWVRLGAAFVHSLRCACGWSLKPGADRDHPEEFVLTRYPDGRTCDVCRGTGHNLAGALAPVEPSPLQRRKDARRDPAKDADGRADTPPRRAARRALRLGIAGNLAEWERLRAAGLEQTARGAWETVDAAQAIAAGDHVAAMIGTARAAEAFAEGARLLGLPREAPP